MQDLYKQAGGDPFYTAGREDRALGGACMRHLYEKEMRDKRLGWQLNSIDSVQSHEENTKYERNHIDGRWQCILIEQTVQLAKELDNR